GYKFLIYENEAFLIGYNGDDHALALPNSINGMQYSIAPYAFYYNSKIASIMIPASVTTIGDFAFSGTRLVSVDILGETLEYVGRYAFAGCSDLIFINLPDTVTYIGQNAFQQCKVLETINLGRITSIEDRVFSYCISIKEIVIPNTVKYIGKYAFESAGVMTSITFEENSICEYIDVCAFYCCTNLKTINIPDSVKTIYSGAFNNCESLQSVNFGENSKLESLGADEAINGGFSYAFGECKALKSIILPESLKEIGAQTFYMCYNLEWIVVGSESKSAADQVLKKVSPSAFFIIKGADRYKLRAIYFRGSASSQWNPLGVSLESDITVYYYSKSKKSGNYWRYVNGVPTSWN
ncbi:MAG: leucine-rich repeat protein, partial [Clostridiales bacterium]|nr:leucine-rich repeat protein [Clostridiales bacterium]